MFPNKLYHLLYYKKSQSIDFKLNNDITIFSEKNKNGLDYYRLKFPPRPGNLFYPFRLKEAHISIYAVESNTEAMLSQYHFTAFLEGSTHQRFRVHVFFDEFDQLTMAPQFSIQQSEGNFVATESLLKDEILSQIAQTYTLPVIAELRQLQNDLIAQLATTYGEIEATCAKLSEQLPTNKMQYTRQAKDAINSLDALRLLTGNHYYERIARHFNQMIAAIAQQSSSKSEQSTVDETCVVGHSLIKPDKQLKKQSVKTVSNLLPLSTVLNNKFQNLQNEIIAFFQEKKKPSLEKSTALNRFVNKIALLSLEFDTHQVKKLSLLTLCALHKLDIQIHREGGQWLEQCLLTCDFLTAKQLSIFYTTIDRRQLFIRALMERNHQLLDFLLAEMKFCEINQPITFDGPTKEVYDSPIHYCVAMHTTAQSMKDCLSVLIKHGANIIVSFSHQLPIAHTLMFTPEHPLKTALLENAERTLYNKQFNNQLLFAVRQYVNSMAENDTIGVLYEEQWLPYYQSQINQVYLPKSGSRDKFYQIKHSLRELVTDNLGDDVLVRLQSDPDILKLKTAVDKLNKQILSRLSTRDKLRLPQQAIAHTDKIKLLLSTFASKGLAQPNYEETKNVTLYFFEKSLSCCQLTIELLDLQDTMKKVPFIMGKKNKKFKKLLIAEEQIFEKISQLKAFLSLETIETRDSNVGSQSNNNEDQRFVNTNNRDEVFMINNENNDIKENITPALVKCMTENSVENAGNNDNDNEESTVSLEENEDSDRRFSFFSRSLFEPVHNADTDSLSENEPLYKCIIL